MTNGNDLVGYVSCEAVANDNLGLTKREYFAAMAMQGIMGNQAWSGVKPEIIQSKMETSVECADALIAALNKC